MHSMLHRSRKGIHVGAFEQKWSNAPTDLIKNFDISLILIMPLHFHSSALLNLLDFSLVARVKYIFAKIARALLKSYFTMGGRN